MQPLIDVHSGEELEQLVAKLHASGIPTFHKVHGSRYHSYYVLFVRIDAQLEDARNLLANSSYIVKNPVVVDDHLTRASGNTHTQTSASMAGWMTQIAIILAVVVGIGVVILQANS